MNDFLMFSGEHDLIADDRGACASPDQVVPPMYQRLLGALRAADAALTARDEAALARSFDTASGIVFELLGTLNFRDGGELTPRLAALYGYFASELLVLGHSPDFESIDRLTEMVEILSGQWRRDGRHERQAYLRQSIVEHFTVLTGGVDLN